MNGGHTGLIRLVRDDAGRSLWRFVSARIGDAPSSTAASWPFEVGRRAEAARDHGAVAARDLEAGDLVCSEEPFVQTVHDSVLSCVCHVCYRLLSPAAQPPRQCYKCEQVQYCSEACQLAGATAHAAECQVLVALATNERAQAAVRSLRLYMRLVHRVHEDPESLPQLERLQEHYSGASPERQHVFVKMADQINGMCPPAVHLEPVRLAKLISRVHSHLHAVGTGAVEPAPAPCHSSPSGGCRDRPLSADSVRVRLPLQWQVCDVAGTQLGSGLYLQAALFSHSCAPSAVASFCGRAWRLHTLRAVRRGELLTYSFTDMFAGRLARRLSLQHANNLECDCERCTRPPAMDAQLDGWQCADCAAGPAEAAELATGVLGPGEFACARCGGAAPEAPLARLALEARWQLSIAEAMQTLGGRPHKDAPAAASATALRVASSILAESGGRLCERHVLRHRARRLRVYALKGCQQWADLVPAIEAVLADMQAVLPAAHPEVAFFTRWLAAALTELGAHHRASQAAAAAADALAISYGADHPSVATWRAQATWSACEM